MEYVHDKALLHVDDFLSIRPIRSRPLGTDGLIVSESEKLYGYDTICIMRKEILDETRPKKSSDGNQPKW